MKKEYNSKLLVEGNQKNPGIPMGQAITAKVLDAKSEISKTFVEWLRRMFQE